MSKTCLLPLEGEEKKKAMGLFDEIRRLAFEILKDPEATSRAEKVVPLKDLEAKASTHKASIAESNKLSTTTSRGMRW